jgi:flagellin
MGLRIANNISAMNTHRWLSISDSQLTQSLERLSSGYRINKAADDAAGLAISEGFRADVASFKVASQNASEASSLLQVAEGGMEQIGNMLTRLKELATQASSANVGSNERVKIDAEADALVAEIDRLANSTKYGSTSLLDGTFGASQLGTLGAGTAGDGIIDDANDNVVYDFTLSGGGDADSGTQVTALGASVAEGTYTIAQTAAGVITITNSSGSITESYAGSLTGTTLTFGNIGITITFTGAISNASGFSDATADTSVKFERTGMTSLNVGNAATGTYNITETTAGEIKITNSDGSSTQTLSYQSHTETLNFDVLGVSFTLGSDYSNTTSELDGMQVTVAANTDASGNTFQIGAENNSNNQISISIDGVTTVDIGVDGIDLSTASGAQAALNSIDSAISTLAGSRGDIGAYMNRLSYAAANLTSTIENVQAAESVIRDVDMASEMTEFTKYQILLQAGTAMLAQANMAPQQVLSLFG